MRADRARGQQLLDELATAYDEVPGVDRAPMFGSEALRVTPGEPGRKAPHVTPGEPGREAPHVTPGEPGREALRVTPSEPGRPSASLRAPGDESGAAATKRPALTASRPSASGRSAPKVFAFVGREGQLIVKLPAPRVAELLAAGEAEPVHVGRNATREWAGIPYSADRAQWRKLLAEAHAFVGAATPEGRRANRDR
ncbi:hypothetical protein [Kribbella sp. DT2]|uniref:hypothetical protein n=1 Tax=Kribbella sp. DT2 TaxID=3393427 RepID=UPI003CE82A90